jgi:hypothetical protein
MAVSLSKGGNVSLSKEAPGLSEVIVGLGWDPRVTDGTEFDLDARCSSPVRPVSSERRRLHLLQQQEVCRRLHRAPG